MLGDWRFRATGGLLRDPTDLLRVALFLGVFAQLPRENWSGALRLALTFLVCCAPRMLEVPKPFDFAFVFAMSLQAWGNIAGAFEAWLPYHDLVHCVLTLATAALFYFALVRLRLVPDPTEQTSPAKQLGVAQEWRCGRSRRADVHPHEPSRDLPPCKGC